MVAWKELEEEFNENIQYVELLGELNLQREWMEHFGNWIAHQFRQYGSVKALRILEQTYPASLAVYLVAIGVFKYQEGNYWSGVVEDVELSAANEQALRQFFTRFLEMHHLPSFTELEGHKYVGSILLHGGIPNYSLNDFFNHILHPALLNPSLHGVDAREVISTWLERGSQSSVDKPIIRFLRYGEKIAVDFVERCLDMGRYYHDYGRVPGAEEIGLPERVVLAYKAWAQQQGKAKQSSKARLVRPSILLDPWGESLLVDLPAQVISSTDEEALLALINLGTSF